MSPYLRIALCAAATIVAVSGCSSSDATSEKKNDAPINMDGSEDPPNTKDGPDGSPSPTEIGERLLLHGAEEGYEYAAVWDPSNMEAPARRLFEDELFPLHSWGSYNGKWLLIQHDPGEVDGSSVTEKVVTVWNIKEGRKHIIKYTSNHAAPFRFGPWSQSGDKVVVQVDRPFVLDLSQDSPVLVQVLDDVRGSKDGGPLRLASDARWSPGDAQWSHDDSLIAAVAQECMAGADCLQTRNLYVIDPTGEKPSQLVDRIEIPGISRPGELIWHPAKNTLLHFGPRYSQLRETDATQFPTVATREVFPEDERCSYCLAGQNRFYPSPDRSSSVYAGGAGRLAYAYFDDAGKGHALRFPQLPLGSDYTPYVFWAPDGESVVVAQLDNNIPDGPRYYGETKAYGYHVRLDSSPLVYRRLPDIYFDRTDMGVSSDRYRDFLSKQLVWTEDSASVIYRGSVEEGEIGARTLLRVNLDGTDMEASVVGEVDMNHKVSHFWLHPDQEHVLFLQTPRYPKPGDAPKELEAPLTFASLFGRGNAETVLIEREEDLYGSYEKPPELHWSASGKHAALFSRTRQSARKLYILQEEGTEAWLHPDSKFIEATRWISWPVDNEFAE